MTAQLSTQVAISRRIARRSMPSSRLAPIAFRGGTPADAHVLHALIASHAQEGRLLPRQLDELRTHASRFVVATRRGRIVGCAELAPLSARIAEVRSLVVHRSARTRGVGGALVAELHARARRAGLQSLCAFTHDAGYFVRLGFSIVPHTWVPEKIAVDCQTCPMFRRCGQFAVVTDLTEPVRKLPAARRLAAVGA